jgi:hypothetical protein
MRSSWLHHILSLIDLRLAWHLSLNHSFLAAPVDNEAPYLDSCHSAEGTHFPQQQQPASRDNSPPDLLSTIPSAFVAEHPILLLGVKAACDTFAGREEATPLAERCRLPSCIILARALQSHLERAVQDTHIERGQLSWLEMGRACQGNRRQKLTYVEVPSFLL